MEILALGYITLKVADLDAWERYASALGGVVTHDEDRPGFRIKIDDRPWRIAVEPTDGAEGLGCAGWELRDAAALEQAITQLGHAHREVRVGTSGDCAARGVRGLVHVTDPGGFALELYHGPIHDHRPFVSPTGITGFVTGGMGLGHIVLGTPDHRAAVSFYLDVLGLRVSDFMRHGETDIVFARCNARHHSLALVAAAEPALHHFMLEAQSVDDVGQVLDHHRRDGFEVSMDLGRHPNDQMLSFYGRSPSGFDVEVGCGGRRIDESTWVVNEITQASLWGHQRQTGLTSA